MSHKIDLNLFRVFEAVLAQRSVSAAANELHLSPSAVSHALARLREVLDDPLFVAGPAGMAPTARALDLAPHVRAGLDRIDGAVAHRTFDPAQARRTFRIAATDYGTAAVLPPLLARLAQAAPQIDLRVFPLNRLDTIRQLDEGRIDLAISWFAELPERMRSQAVWRDLEALVARPGHPLVGQPLTRAQLLAYPHVVVELTGSGEASDGDGDGYLDDRGVTRRIWIERLLLELRQDGPLAGRAAVSVPHYAAVVPLVRASDMLATLPLTLAQAAARHGDVALLPLPFAPQPATLDAIWHARGDGDDGLQWLLAQMRAPAHEISTA